MLEFIVAALTIMVIAMVIFLIVAAFIVMPYLSNKFFKLEEDYIKKYGRAWYEDL